MHPEDTCVFVCWWWCLFIYFGGDRMSLEDRSILQSLTIKITGSLWDLGVGRALISCITNYVYVRSLQALCNSVCVYQGPWQCTWKIMTSVWHRQPNAAMNVLLLTCSRDCCFKKTQLEDLPSLSLLLSFSLSFSGWKQ